MSTPSEAYKSLPAVDKLLCTPEVAKLISSYGRELVTFAIRQSIEFYRESLKNGAIAPASEDVITKAEKLLLTLNESSLRKVYNATGIIINTNLGRAPFSEEMLSEACKKLAGYSNLEFDLNTGSRGSRNVHPAKILKFLTGAEDILVVNNAAAAVMLCLNTFAKRKEVIVSRGELVEIGGSFRIPDVMAASGCKMVEVGTTNKTKLSDYSNALNSKTAILFKAHKSNYIIKGFTEEVELTDLCKLGKEHNIPVIYDQGSGLLKNIKNTALSDEVSVKSSIESGVDIICFSGDKLLGGPQAGIIAGKKALIDKLKKNPMLRALRVCKITLAMLETACSAYLNEDDLFRKNMVFRLVSQKPAELKKKADKLNKLLDAAGINCKTIENNAQIGGGSLPDKEIPGFAVHILADSVSNKERSDFAESLYHKLLNHSTPIAAILKKGNLIVDVLTLDENDLEIIASIIADSVNGVKSVNTK